MSNQLNADATMPQSNSCPLVVLRISLHCITGSRSHTNKMPSKQGRRRRSSSLYLRKAPRCRLCGKRSTMQNPLHLASDSATLEDVAQV
eukprot:2171039-Amphidinium_carterae.1